MNSTLSPSERLMRLAKRQLDNIKAKPYGGVPCWQRYYEQRAQSFAMAALLCGA